MPIVRENKLYHYDVVIGSSANALARKCEVYVGRGHRLTTEGALIREVSIQAGLTSMALEKQRRGVETCLGLMFERPMPLETLGIVLTDSRSDLAES